MGTDLLTRTNFYFLNQNFEFIHKLTQYESLMWVDKYDEPGSFEIYAPPTEEIKMAAKIDNYFYSDKSEHLMIIEKLETTVSPENGERLVISGRSLESILDRRVIFLSCYFRDENSPVSGQTIAADNLEDAVRQILDVSFIHPKTYDESRPAGQKWVDDPDRAISNFIFQSTGLTTVLKDCEFDKGENILNIVNTIVKQQNLGYKITLNSNKQFVFSLYKGLDRTASQFVNPAVIFAPKFNNIKNTKFTEDSGSNFRNFVYTEGESYNNTSPTIVKTGTATGLLRREVYVSADAVHETESTNVSHEGITKEKKTLTEAEYQEALSKEAEKTFKSFSAKTTLESEVEPRLTFQYGRDFGIGDILEVQDGTGNKGSVRCVEFIISHSESGYEEYPTFKNVIDEEESPSQTTASGGEYTDGSSRGSGGGHDYNVKMDSTNENMTLTEDSADKTTIPLVTVFTRSKAEWDSLTVAEKTKYRLAIFQGGSPYSVLPSHIGQIIESTTLSTLEQMREVYGANTSWIQHTGYVLRGATSNVTANDNSNSGSGFSGSDTHAITENEMPSHNHNTSNDGAHTHNLPYSTLSDGYDSYRLGGTKISDTPIATNGSTHNHTITYTGGGVAISLQQRSKNVYIWERTA